MTMAQDDQTVVETEGAAEGADQPAKKGLSKLILFGGIGVGAIVIGIVLALFVVGPMMGGGDKAETTEEATAAEEEDSGHHEEAHGEESGGHGESSGHGEEGGHGAAPAASGTLFSIDNIVINPAGTNGSRFLSTSIAFELGSSDLGRKFQERQTVIRDALITILSAKTVAQLTTPKQKEITRYQIRKRVAQLLEAEDIPGVYYTDFVLQ